MRRDSKYRSEGVLRVVKLLRCYDVVLVGKIGLVKQWAKLLEINGIEREHSSGQEETMAFLKRRDSFFRESHSVIKTEAIKEVEG